MVKPLLFSFEFGNVCVVLPADLKRWRRVIHVGTQQFQKNAHARFTGTVKLLAATKPMDAVATFYIALRCFTPYLMVCGCLRLLSPQIPQNYADNMLAEAVSEKCCQY